MEEVAIQMRNVTVAYDAKPVLWNVSADIKKGKSTAIIGPNGAGKSTLMKTMLDLKEAVAGSVKFSTDSKQAQTFGQVKNDIAYVPQKSAVDWDFPTTVLDVTLMGRYGQMGWFKRPNKKDKQIAEEMLAKVGMSSFKNRQISQLSGGQRQRVFLARALAQQANIYILDEPLAGVDMKTETVIIQLLKELTAQGNTVIIVHHDLQTVEEYFDEVLFLNHEVVAYGSVAEVFSDENIGLTYRKDRNLGEEVGG